jgi:hypothetical protein
LRTSRLRVCASRSAGKWRRASSALALRASMVLVTSTSRESCRQQAAHCAARQRGRRRRPNSSARPSGVRQPRVQASASATPGAARGGHAARRSAVAGPSIRRGGAAGMVRRRGSRVAGAARLQHVGVAGMRLARWAGSSLRGGMRAGAHD